MAIPTWVLLQKTGGDWAKSLGGKEGQFHNTGSDEIADELNLIVVDILMGRARWSSEISDAGPLCASLDAKSNFSVNGDDCTRCEFRLDTPWAADATERRKMCCLNYTILGITINDYMPCIIRAHGISALPVRQLISQLRLNRSLKGEYFRAIINIKSQEKTGRAGTAYALHPKIVELITDETKVIELKAESNRLLGAPIPLPEGRPEEEPVPLGFTPEGIPFYSEAEKDRLMAPAAAPPATEPEPEPEPAPETTTPPAPETTALEPKPEPPAPTTPPATPPAAKETEAPTETKESPKRNLDLDF
ncbi:hypothetical protein ES703_120474 [subsurface metagenome]